MLENLKSDGEAKAKNGQNEGKNGKNEVNSKLQNSKKQQQQQIQKKTSEKWTKSISFKNPSVSLDKVLSKSSTTVNSPPKEQSTNQGKGKNKKKEKKGYYSQPDKNGKRNDGIKCEEERNGDGQVDLKEANCTNDPVKAVQMIQEGLSKSKRAIN